MWPLVLRDWDAVLGGIVGDDREASVLRDALVARGVRDVVFETSRACRTTIKTRILAGNGQQLLRIDRESDREALTAPSASLLERVRSTVAACNALILADYDKGALTHDVIAELIAEAVRQGKPVIVDPKKTDFLVYKGATILTPNVYETERALGRPLVSDGEIVAVATQLRADCALGVMLVTRGPKGMTGVDETGAFHIPARVREVADVAGAGDTVVAVLGAALALRVNVRVAAEWASVAAGIAVGHAGTYVVAAEELRTALAGRLEKVVDWETAKSIVERTRKIGRRIVFTNGCFDLLHAGHLHSLREARSLGGFLVVGLNSDMGVRSLKGPSRPIVSEQQRAALLAGFECVDLVVLFDEPTPESLIRQLVPDVLAKGSEYDVASIAGGDFVRSQGGSVHRLTMVEGLSTSVLLKKLK
jgi:D-beta-D-heptose 7-phosphate kinase/D-beta-D-heptose 1-phosphate adenosyltransferase